MTASRARPLAAPALIAAALALSACNTTQTAQSGTGQQVVRSAVETAPADLQLLCASEAAKVYAAPGDKVLPLSSARSGPASFDVELDVAGRRARCTIDESGTAITVVDA